MPFSIVHLKIKLFLIVSVLLSVLFTSVNAVESYSVHFEGTLTDEMKQIVHSASQLIALEKNPPSTEAALRRRAEADIPRIAKALQSLAYYDVHTDVAIDLKTTPALITFTINPGPKFKLGSFTVKPSEASQQKLCSCVTLEEIGIVLKSAAYPKTILEAEEAVLNIAARCGYPLARIAAHHIEADLTKHLVYVTLTLDSGPQAFFGKTKISGNKDVHPAFFQKKIAWQEGAVFDPTLLEITQHDMEASALFSSIVITHAQKVDENGSLPIHIEVVESKQRSIGVGVGYSTLRHFGALAEFENRNMRQRGERLSFRTTFWKNTGYEGRLFYLTPDWLYRKQDLLGLLEARHQITEGYTETSFSASLAVESPIGKYTRASYGVMVELLRNTRSDNDGNFNLLKLPCSLKWTFVDNPIDPKEGYSLNYICTPTAQLLHKGFAYCVNTLVGTAYVPLDKDKKSILALRTTWGSILGATRRTIPPSERFYAGSEQTLRGYYYLSVSPLDRDHNPLGGRSMMIYNIEWRWRSSESLEWVLFYDIGNVYDSYIPQVYYPQLQAVGMGVRYHTPVGPLRLDVAFPLQPRRHLDHLFEIYLSMGQTF
jgi:translocation and assembly module TamA